MNITKAKQLKYGAAVNCPADHGGLGFGGKVVDRNDLSHVSVYKTASGVEYIWVLVKGVGSEAIWPSHRLGGY